MTDVGDGEAVVATGGRHQRLPAAPGADSTLWKAPRTLNEPECWNSSSFSVTGRPSTSTSSSGVRRTHGAIRATAARMSSYVGTGQVSHEPNVSSAACPAGPRVPCASSAASGPTTPHWEFDGVRLGVDGHGTWIGITEGTLLASPVRAFHAAADHVTLVPHDAWWLGTFYGDDPKRPFDTYVDIATPAVWHGEDLVRAVDLDLDVIRGTTGRIWVDDEDEFAAHRVALGYPDEVIEQAVDQLPGRSLAADDRAGGALRRRRTATGWPGCASSRADLSRPVSGNQAYLGVLAGFLVWGVRFAA